MHLAVGDHDRAADARGGTSRKALSSAPNRRVSVRSSAAPARPASTTRTSNWGSAPAAPAGRRPPRRSGGAVADVLALAAVDDQRDDALQRLALLVEQTGLTSAAASAAKAPARSQAPRWRRTAGSRAGAIGARIAASHAARKARVRRRRTSSCSLPQPFEQGRHVHLVGFVVAGQHVHHDVDAGAVAHRRAASDRDGTVGSIGSPFSSMPRRRRNRCR
jgi:hypothetical protein